MSGGDVTVIAPKVAGFISEVAVADNQRVKAGDLLIRLDDRDYKAALAKADATYAAQEATLANLDATLNLQQAMIAQADAEVASTDAERARSRFDYDRYRELAASKYASEQRFQQADSENKKANAGGLKARAALDAARRQLDVIDTQKAQARAARDQAAADRDIARLNLGYTEIRAPIDGLIGNRSAHVGAYATVGAGADLSGAGDGLVGRCQFQGKPGRDDAGRTARDDRRGRAAGRGAERPRRQPRAGDRGAVQHSAGGKTRPATSPRSCSACRCGSRSMAMPATLGLLRPGLSVTCLRRSSATPAPSQAADHRRAPAALGAPAPAERSARADVDDRDAEDLRIRGHVRRIFHRAARHSDRVGLAAATSAAVSPPAQDEVTWVQTSYLIAEIIVIPLTGGLARVMSTRWLFCHVRHRLHRRPAWPAAGRGTSAA